MMSWSPAPPSIKHNSWGAVNFSLHKIWKFLTLFNSCAPGNHLHFQTLLLQRHTICLRQLRHIWPAHWATLLQNAQRITPLVTPRWLPWKLMLPWLPLATQVVSLILHRVLCSSVLGTNICISLNLIPIDKRLVIIKIIYYRKKKWSVISSSKIKTSLFSQRPCLDIGRKQTQFKFNNRSQGVSAAFAF